MLGPNKSTVSTDDTSETSLGGCCCAAQPVRTIKPRATINDLEILHFRELNREVDMAIFPNAKGLPIKGLKLRLTVQQKFSLSSKAAP